MRAPRIRFTVRRMMFVVIILAMILGYAARWLRYRRLAERYLDQSFRLATLREVRPNGSRIYDSSNNSWNYLKKSEEYESAKWWPWINVSAKVKPEFED